MADIRIARPHALPLSRAKAVAQAAADDLAREYVFSCQWRGDVLEFRRNGVHGRIEVSPSQIAVEIHLGLLLKGFRKAIEQRVAQHMDALVTRQAPPVAGDALAAPGVAGTAQG